MAIQDVEDRIDLENLFSRELKVLGRHLLHLLAQSRHFLLESVHLLLNVLVGDLVHILAWVETLPQRCQKINFKTDFQEKNKGKVKE